MSARCQELVIAQEHRGSGITADPHRIVVRIYDKDGNFIAENDPCAPKHTVFGHMTGFQIDQDMRLDIADVTNPNDDGRQSVSFEIGESMPVIKMLGEYPGPLERMRKLNAVAGEAQQYAGKVEADLNAAQRAKLHYRAQLIAVGMVIRGVLRSRSRKKARADLTHCLQNIKTALQVPGNSELSGTVTTTDGKKAD